MIKYGGTSIDICKILRCCKNLYQILNFILWKFDYILKIFKKEQKCINIEEIIDIETNSLEKIKEIHEELLKKEKLSNYCLIRFEKIINKHINYFQNRDIKNLLFLNIMINNHQKYGNKLKSCSLKIIEVIKKTVFYLISIKGLNTKDIIDLIQKLDISLFKYREKEIFNAINIYELTENDYPKLFYLWEAILEQKDIVYTFAKIEILKDFGIIYKLIPNWIFDNIIAKGLESKFKNLLLNTYNICSCPNILDDIYKTIEIFISINYSPKEFLSIIEESNNLSTKMISKVYLKVIQDTKLNRNKEIKAIALKFLIERNIKNDINSIESIIKAINAKDKDLIQIFLKVILNFSIFEEDFYNPIMLHKFKLYINIYPKFHNYISSDYFQISNLALNNVYNNIFRLELNYNEFNKLI